jgi:hypothetical protein
MLVREKKRMGRGSRALTAGGAVADEDALGAGVGEGKGCVGLAELQVGNEILGEEGFEEGATAMPASPGAVSGVMRCMRLFLTGADHEDVEGLWFYYCSHCQ